MNASPDWPTRDLLASRADTTPGATAVVAARDGRSVTYGRLNDLVSHTAARYVDALDESVRPATDGDHRRWIAIDGQTSLRFVVALFAAWRLGAAVVPLGVEQSATVRRDRLDGLDPALLVEAASTDRPTDVDSSILSYDAIPTSPPDEPADGSQIDAESGRLGPQWSSDETALLLFTSGTTGKPNGVRLTHGNLVASATGSAFRLGVRPDDRWFDPLPTNHMGGLAPIVRATLYGTAVVLQPTFDVAETATALDARDATGVSLVPTQLRRLLDDGWRPGESLRFVLLGGAPADADLLADCEAAGVPVCPTYGTTETASQIATATPEEAASHPESVGSPLVVADVTIVDPADGTRLEPGATGELVVDGPIVTPGYLDAEATASAFGDDGLHTGDLATRDEDGRLRIVGRLDDAIQTGGETVHPWRVTDVLVAHPAVVDAAVVGLPDPEWGERVTALVATEAGGGDVADELHARCRRDLATYEVPKTIETAEALPRTASGTIDRAAVRDRLAE